MSLLEIDGLSIRLPGRDGGKALVEDVSLHVAAGEVVGLAGESGSGKTLTALSVLGMVPHGARTGGEVRFDGRDVLALRPRDLRELRGAQVAMVFQDPTTALHPMLDVGTQITEHLRVHRGISKRAAAARALELLEQVRIPNPAEAVRAYPHRFSGGMKQRIAIAVALACEPRLLIADEPTTALDVTVQAGVLRLLDDLRAQTGMAVLLITHDLGVMNVTSDRLYVMKAGRVVEEGRTREVLAAPGHPYTASLLDALSDPGTAPEGGPDHRSPGVAATGLGG
ncbi:ABC transporter ATP-binding protein [Blastococcus sp. MG754426]|uniref:ABC transporter ATP-binding protein n=1 Tax=unclassified Blastococcus TaxID=2619396 RepID=UPI001EF0A2B0|nr:MULTISPECIES: ABC transporter ATP-binding protein [unclassified Blastococcus]MCF6506815.1 ABC transporter ATP-binding protein [Blastococcus sp. MG754426]MCF6511615.1 ABC transporter ATP-binding protein [Blastococcus sp. MG754427]